MYEVHENIHPSIAFYFTSISIIIITCWNKLHFIKIYDKYFILI